MDFDQGTSTAAVALWSAMACWVLGVAALTAWVARLRNRDSLAWFGIGLLLNLAALLAVGMSPEKPERERSEFWKT